jgi:hypothetical protein
MQKWEYMYVEAYKDDVRAINGELSKQGADSLPPRLTRWGDEGWELIAITTMNETGDSWRLVFKRPKQK